MIKTELRDELKMRYDFLSIKRIGSDKRRSYESGGCALCLLKKVFSDETGETLYLSKENLPCHGAVSGFGISDGLPNIPGGFGHFISSGRGEGFPPGERVKCSPAVGESMFLGQPQDVMDGYDCIRVKPYDPSDDADTVTALVTPDQLSALIHLFSFRKAGYEDIIAPMVSGCASIFRIPFGELKRESPRAVIGNIDVFSRPHFDANTVFFTVSGKDFESMLSDAKESVLSAVIWKGVKSRL